MTKISSKHPKYPKPLLGNFRCFRCILVILHVQGHFGHNLGFRDFYRSFFLRLWGYFGHFLGFGDNSIIFQVLGYFGNFLGFGGISVIFQVLEVCRSFFQVQRVFWLFFRFMVYFGNCQVLGVFRSFFFRFLGYFGQCFRFWGYFSNFLGLGCILVILRFRGYFVNFLLGLGDILVIFQVSRGYFSPFFRFQGISVIF